MRPAKIVALWLGPLVLGAHAVSCEREVSAGPGWKQTELGKRHLYEVVVTVEAEGDTHNIIGVFECVYKRPPILPTSTPGGGMRRYVYAAAKTLPSGSVLLFIDPTQRACGLDGDAFRRGEARWRLIDADIFTGRVPKIIWADDAKEPRQLKVYFPDHYAETPPEIRFLGLRARPVMEGRVTDPRIEAPFIQDMIRTENKPGGRSKLGSWLSMSLVFVEELDWRGSTRENDILGAADRTQRDDSLSTAGPILVEGVYLGGKYFGSYGKDAESKYLQDNAQITALQLNDDRLICFKR